MHLSDYSIITEKKTFFGLSQKFLRQIGKTDYQLQGDLALVRNS
jgi:hypothetical protein